MVVSAIDLNSFEEIGDFLRLIAGSAVSDLVVLNEIGKGDFVAIRELDSDERCDLVSVNFAGDAEHLV